MTQRSKNYPEHLIFNNLKRSTKTERSKLIHQVTLSQQVN